AFRVEWHSGAPSASITVDENLLQYVEMEVRDKVLHVRTTRSVRPTHSIRLALTSNALEGASFSGASRLDAHQLSGPKFYLETTGASNARLPVRVQSGSARRMIITSSCRAKAEGSHCKSLNATFPGYLDLAGDDELVTIHSPVRRCGSGSKLGGGWRTLSAFNAGHSLAKPRSRRHDVRFARTNGNSFATTGSSGRRCRSWRCIIATVSKKRHHDFTASERNRNSQLLSALCWCSRPQEICCGIAFHCSRTTRSQKSGRAEVFGRSRSRIRTFIPQWSNGRTISTRRYIYTPRIANGSCATVRAFSFGKAQPFRFGMI